MEIEELLRLNAEGLIPGPGETEAAFEKRVQETQAAFELCEEVIPFHQWVWASEQVKELFDFRPRWCKAVCSNRGLVPWQAAATWIDVKRIYTIQINSSRWVSWCVNRDELLAHEAAHAARAAFDEPKSEELFAYLTSPKKWRRTIGSLFSSPAESYWFVGSIGLGGILQFIEDIWGIWALSGLCFMAAAMQCAGYAIRLMRIRVRLEKAAKRLRPLLRDSTKVRAVLFRMTDEEIFNLSRKKQLNYPDELRWKVLRAAYFND